MKVCLYCVVVIVAELAEVVVVISIVEVEFPVVMVFVPPVLPFSELFPVLLILFTIVVI